MALETVLAAAAAAVAVAAWAAVRAP
eukprot:COSAG01_NODE_72224_length_253_cov_1.324675_2_plen_25_part_01